ncbi:MAG: site-specific integrase [Planctomyces sp.]|nr:site-specific integrase [Planctomyces sp.]
MPKNAELFTKQGEQYARWKPSRGRVRTARVTIGKDGLPRIVDTAGTFTARYRDGEGIVREVATGCRDEMAARAVLGELERRAELVLAKIISPAEDKIANQQDVPFLTHVEHFVCRRTKRAPNGVTQMGQNNTRARLTRLAKECGFRVLSDLQSEALDRWMREQLAGTMSPANINEFRNELIIFANWCVRNRRMLVNPFNDVPKLDASAHPRRKRRSLTEQELLKLLRVARWRPIAEFGRQPISAEKPPEKSSPDPSTGKKRKKWTYAALTLDDLDAAVERGRERLKNSPDHIAKLDRLGRERALIFKTLVLTGLRKGELAAVTVGHLDLDGPIPVINMNSDETKNRQRAAIPLRADLADDLRRWRETLRNERQGFTDTDGERIALRFQRDAEAPLPLDTPLFTVPAGLVRILDRDLVAAGIPKRDERGWTIDVHALRHSFGTLLSKGGVAPRTAQAAMRHSDIGLTMNVYTDPRLLDIEGALDALPSLPLIDDPSPQRELMKATGTEGRRSDFVAPDVAPTSDVSSQNMAFADTSARIAAVGDPALQNAENLEISSKKALFAGFANKASEIGVTGFEPAASTSRT